jgi:two-component system OmpR family sensor kinase/two-component system sensor histidine kinase QseC
VRPPRRPWSLRRRLLAIATVSSLLAWLTGGAATYYLMQRQDAQLFDSRLRDIAQTLMAFADHEINEKAALQNLSPSHIETEGTSQDRFRYQVWSQDGRLVLSSRNAPTNQALMPLDQNGWMTRRFGDETLRVIAIVNPALKYRIQAAEAMNQRLVLADLFGPALVPAVVLSAVVLTVSTLILLRLALQPLKRATEQLGQRGPADLSAVPTSHLPAEFAPVLEAINRLMDRVAVALRSEREFVAAAAHELRTPLAGLHAQAQLASYPRSSPSQREQALKAVREGVDHAAHLVNQLLDLARSDALAGDTTRILAEHTVVDLRKVFERCLQSLSPLAAERHLRLHPDFEVPGLYGSDFGLGLILRNLLANAIVYTAPNSEVKAGSRAEPGLTVLWVSDQGPGIPQAERDRVLERFYRAKGNTAPGCGLGLSIVKALADAHEARIALLDAPGGGLLVEVRFPT